MQAHSLADRYIAIWNERDAARRDALIAQTWTESALYIDPLSVADGHQAISAMIGQVHGQFPGHRFVRTDDVNEHHDRVFFSWALVSADGAAAAHGFDFGVIAIDGRLCAVTGFLRTV
jgi:hypothetical protein